MQPGYNAQLFQNAGVRPDPSSQQSSGGGDWLSHLLPTIGSVAAPVLGALLAPETGGASLLAGAALSGLGSAGGKVAENAIENKSLGDNVTNELGSGALGGLAGGVGGKVIGGILGKLGAQGATDAAAQTAVDGMAPYAGLADKTLSKNNALDNLGMLQKMGVDTSNPQSVLDAAGSVTGENGALNGMKNQFIMQSGPVSLDPDALMAQVKSAIVANPQIGSKGNATLNAIHQMVQGISPEGNVSGQLDPTNVFDAIKQLGAAKGSLDLNGESGKAIANIYDTARGGLQDALYKNAGADNLVSAYKVTPEDMQAITDASGGNQALANHMADVLNNANSIQDIRSAEAPFVQSSALAKSALDKIQATLPTAIDSTTPDVGQHLGAAAQMLAGHPLAAAGTMAGGVVNGVQKAANIFDQLPAGLQAASAAGAATLPSDVFTHAGDFTQGTGQSIPSSLTSIGGQNNQQGEPTMNNGQPAQGGMAPQGGAQQTIDPQMLTNVVLADLRSTGGKNLGTLVPALQGAMYGGLGQLGSDLRQLHKDLETCNQPLVLQAAVKER
jgi:hypothetical protein